MKSITNSHYKMRKTDKMVLANQIDPEMATIYKDLIIYCHLGDMEAERSGFKDPFKKKEKKKETKPEQEVK